MSNIECQQNQSTFAGVAFAAGVLVNLCSIPLGHPNVDIDEYKSLMNPTYYSTANSATHTRIFNAMTGEFASTLNSFENVISNFYTNFLSKQEPLGGDFEEILNDNIWELYES